MKECSAEAALVLQDVEKSQEFAQNIDLLFISCGIKELGKNEALAVTLRKKQKRLKRSESKPISMYLL